jgi:hypothetical protein
LDFAAGAVPVQFAVGFGDAATGAVVEIGETGGGFNLALGVILSGDRYSKYFELDGQL